MLLGYFLVSGSSSPAGPMKDGQPSYAVSDCWQASPSGVRVPGQLLSPRVRAGWWGHA